MTLPLIREKTIIAVAAGKGGVGKSTLTVNLALALKELGYRVAVLDADVYGPSVRKMLPEEKMPYQKGECIMPADCGGIKMISMAYFRDEGEAAAVRAPIANGLISQFLHKVDWGDAEYLLIDFPPGTGDVQLTLAQKARLTGAVMVTTPQEVAVADVSKAMHLFRQVNVPLLGIVENMCGLSIGEQTLYPLGRGGGKRLARRSGVPFLGEIPIDPQLCRCGDEGGSIFALPEGRPPSAEALLSIARALSGGAGRAEASLAVERVAQPDPQTIEIDWSDGARSRFRASRLQLHCPCAGCVDEETGRRRPEAPEVPEELSCEKVEMVGRYALRLTFSSGCCAGLYEFPLLRRLSEVAV